MAQIHQAPVHQQLLQEGTETLDWWHRLTVGDAHRMNGHSSDQVRRAHVASAVLLVGLAIWALALPTLLLDPTPGSVGAAIGYGAVLAAVYLLNRRGRVRTTAIVLIASVYAPFVLIVATLPGGFDLDHLVLFDILVVAELVAVGLLPPAGVLVVAACNCAMLIGTLLFIPHTAELSALIASGGKASIVIMPLALYVLLGVTAFFLARGVDVALRRAESAERQAEEARQDEAARRVEMEEGVRALLAAHVRLANGNFAEPVAPLRERMLWQVGLALNMLMRRIARLSQAETALRHTQEELRRTHDLAQQLAQAAFACRHGRQVTWPEPNNTALDGLLVMLREEGLSTPHPPQAPTERVVQ